HAALAAPHADARERLQAIDFGGEAAADTTAQRARAHFLAAANGQVVGPTGGGVLWWGKGLLDALAKARDALQSLFDRCGIGQGGIWLGGDAEVFQPRERGASARQFGGIGASDARAIAREIHAFNGAAARGVALRQPAAIERVEGEAAAR